MKLSIYLPSINEERRGSIYTESLYSTSPFGCGDSVGEGLCSHGYPQNPQNQTDSALGDLPTAGTVGLVFIMRVTTVSALVGPATHTHTALRELLFLINL